MQVRFIAQPFDDGRDMREFIGTIGSDAALANLEIVVAWAKRSGLEVIEGDLRGLAQRGCNLRLIVGIDQGGATRQGLELARDLFDEVSVFHDRGGRTFHPKVYVAWGDTSARILVGSHNATAGGAYFNYEAGIELTLQRPADDELLTSFRDFVDKLRSDTAMCQVLTAEVLAELISNPRYRIADEDLRHNPGVPGAPPELDTETDLESIPEPAANPPSIFGPSVLPKKPAPTAAKKVAAKKVAAKKVAANKAPAKQAVVTKAAAGGPPNPAPPTLRSPIVKRWYKTMSYSDAQQPKAANSNVKGVLTLNRNRTHPIDTATYFRQDFFDAVVWQQGAGGKEEAALTAEILVAGVSQGTHALTLDHAESRIAGQGNTPTWLHWNDFGHYLRQHNHKDDVVTIERFADDSYRILIDSSPSGPFMA